MNLKTKNAVLKHLEAARKLLEGVTPVVGLGDEHEERRLSILASRVENLRDDVSSHNDRMAKLRRDIAKLRFSGDRP